MIKSTMIVSTIFLALNAGAQSNANSATKLTVPPRVEPKTTKKDAKAQCREEGRTGKALIDCIKEKSGS